jgi:hypothetical protein
VACCSRCKLVVFLGCHAFVSDRVWSAVQETYHANHSQLSVLRFRVLAGNLPVWAVSFWASSIIEYSNVAVTVDGTVTVEGF